MIGFAVVIPWRRLHLNANTQTHYITVPDGSLACTVDGEGPWLVLIHAGIADSRMWDAQIPDFVGHFRVLSYDMRGFGNSTQPEAAFSHHDDLKSMLEALDIERAHILGVSMGASVALDFALTYPQMVDRLVLCAALGPPPRSESLLAGWAKAEEAFESGGLPAVNEVEMKIWVDGPRRTTDQVDPEVRALVAKMNLPVLQSEDAVEHESTPLDPPAHTRMTEVLAPTLVITGDLDQPDVLDYTARLAAEIPNARLEVIDGAAHMLNMEAASRFNTLVVNFLTD